MPGGRGWPGDGGLHGPTGPGIFQEGIGDFGADSGRPGMRLRAGHMTARPHDPTPSAHCSAQLYLCACARARARLSQSRFLSPREIPELGNFRPFSMLFSHIDQFSTLFVLPFRALSIRISFSLLAANVLLALFLCCPFGFRRNVVRTIGTMHKLRIEFVICYFYPFVKTCSLFLDKLRL